jgi:pantetheine-phosphate adenylyltransferase
MNNRKAVYPGSFDPTTKGHVAVIKKGLNIFDELVVVIANNPAKKGMFNQVERKKLMIDSLAEAGVDMQRVSVAYLPVGNMSVKYAEKIGACSLIRGLRNAKDFEEETVLAYHNKMQVPNIETVFVKIEDQYEKVSSSAVREIASYGGIIDYMVYPNVQKAVEERVQKK